MICIVNNNNIVINIVDTNNITAENQRKYYGWNNIGEKYTDEMPLDYAKKEKLAEINAWTAAKITGGFTSEASGEYVTYDSDKDTQLTMQGIALNVNTELFAEKYPTGCPVRGYKENAESKSVFMLTAEQVMQWCADLSIHIGTCKQEGWGKQAEVKAAQSKEELDKIVLE